jgi:hypothetical protein
MVADPADKSKTLALDPAKRDFDKLRRVLNFLPTTKELVECEDLLALKSRLETKDKLAHPLLEWIIGSNRSHIIKMEPGHLLAEMNTNHQFILIAAAPEKEMAFRDMKKKHKTKFAFHGSPAENWHCILRCGLRNMSGTKDQLHGAAHGEGIYFAPDANTSIGYCRGENGSMMKDDSFLGGGMKCLALCEIIDDGSTIKDHGWCWTVRDDLKVMTRFFFCYNANSSSSADTRKEPFIKSVQAAMQYYSLE